MRFFLFFIGTLFITSFSVAQEVNSFGGVSEVIVLSNIDKENNSYAKNIAKVEEGSPYNLVSEYWENVFEGNLSEASDISDRLLNDFPTFAYGCYLKGVYDLFAESNYNDAYHYFECAINKDNTFWQAELMLGYISALNNKNSVAKAHFKKVEKMVSNRAEVFYFEGLAAFQNEKYTEARKYFSRAIVADSKNSEYYYQRARAHASSGSYSKSIIDLNIAIEMDDDIADYYMLRGEAETEEGLVDDAVADYKNAFRLNPKSVESCTMLGWLFANQGNFQYAIVWFTKALELEPENPEIYYFRGIVYYDKSRYDMALIDFEKAISLLWYEPDVYYYRGFCRYKVNDLNGACEDLTKAKNMGVKGISSALLKKVCGKGK